LDAPADLYVYHAIAVVCTQTRKISDWKNNIYDTVLLKIVDVMIVGCFSIL
jgi:hypothetical protein